MMMDENGIAIWRGLSAESQLEMFSTSRDEIDRLRAENERLMIEVDKLANRAQQAADAAENELLRPVVKRLQAEIKRWRGLMTNCETVAKVIIDDAAKGGGSDEAP